MKQLLALVPLLCLAGCAGQNPAPETAPASVTHDESLPGSGGVRDPSHVHTYVVNDYIDPNNPRLLHQGHPIDVVEQDEKWNLNSGDVSEGNYGPVAAASDPNAAPNPYSAEFETELAQQREQYRQLAALGAQMTTEMDRLQDMAQKEADSVSENASIRDRLQQLQHEIDDLKPQAAPPVTPNASKKSSWLDPVWDLFRQMPDGKPVTDDKPSLQTNLVLRPLPPEAEPSTAATNGAPLPAVPSVHTPAAPPTSTNEPDTSTNEPDASPEPSVPSPGEMSHSAPESETVP